MGIYAAAVTFAFVIAASTGHYVLAALTIATIPAVVKLTTR